MREFEHDELSFSKATQTLERLEVSEDEEYDVYLFWPSMQLGDQRDTLSSPTPSSPLSPADVFRSDLHFYGVGLPHLHLILISDADDAYFSLFHLRSGQSSR